MFSIHSFIVILTLVWGSFLMHPLVHFGILDGFIQGWTIEWHFCIMVYLHPSLYPFLIHVLSRHVFLSTVTPLKWTSSLCFCTAGQVVLDTSLPIRSHGSCGISIIKPIAVCASESVQFLVKGFNLSRPTTRYLWYLFDPKDIFLFLLWLISA